MSYSMDYEFKRVVGVAASTPGLRAMALIPGDLIADLRRGV